jgi:hypothetical protein
MTGGYWVEQAVFCGDGMAGGFCFLGVLVLVKTRR